MGAVEGIVTNTWQGLDARGRSTRSERNQLDAPRELVNMVVDENGHLFMPAASALGHSFPSGDTRIMQMGYVEDPRGIVIQMESGKVYHFGLPIGSQWEPADLDLTEIVASLAAPDALLWTISSIEKGIFGNATRGEGPHDGQTFEVEDDGTGTIVATDVSANDLPEDGQASYSALWKGRRFVVVRGREVYFSELNQHQTFPEDNMFRIGGDDGSNDWVTNPGFVQGMATWEDILLFFMTSSVWMMSGGGGSDSWQLRDTISDMGTNGGAWTLVPTQYGVFSFGGGNQGDRGIYNFQGQTAKKISDPVFQVLSGPLRGRNSFGNYVLHGQSDTEDELQIYLYDYRRQLWTTFDGYRNSISIATPHGFFISDDLDLYHVPADSETPSAFPRKSGRGGKVTVGWEDEGNIAGLVRILGIKVGGKRRGTGTPTIQATVRTPNGGVVTSAVTDIPTDSFDNLVLPVNIRGAAAEITLEITPSSDSSEVLLESLQLIYSRKGEKLSRGSAS